MNEAQLTQVLDGVDEATAFAPGASQQLVPARTPAAQAVTARDSIIEGATKLATDIVALYQDRADDAQRRLGLVRKLAEELIERATKIADEVVTLNERDQRVGEAFARILAENGIEFEGAL
jgi:hypothetical protein